MIKKLEPYIVNAQAVADSLVGRLKSDPPGTFYGPGNAEAVMSVIFSDHRMMVDWIVLNLKHQGYSVQKDGGNRAWYATDKQGYGFRVRIAGPPNQNGERKISLAKGRDCPEPLGGYILWASIISIDDEHVGQGWQVSQDDMALIPEGATSWIKIITTLRQAEERRGTTPEEINALFSVYPGKPQAVPSIGSNQGSD